MHDLQNALTTLSRYFREPILLFDPEFLQRLRYHPERHYMRGPGPACRRKGPLHF